jgi:hypothetical protein
VKNAHAYAGTFTSKPSMSGACALAAEIASQRLTTVAGRNDRHLCCQSTESGQKTTHHSQMLRGSEGNKMCLPSALRSNLDKTKCGTLPAPVPSAMYHAKRPVVQRPVSSTKYSSKSHVFLQNDRVCVCVCVCLFGGVSLPVSEYLFSHFTAPFPFQFPEVHFLSVMILER